MGTKDPRVDAYIAKAAPFAQPILAEIRARIHAACPEVEETLKWSAPAFQYHGLLVDMAAFKKHCACGFWKHDLLIEDDTKASEAMGSFGRLTSIADLPGKREFARLVRAAMRLNEEGIKAPRQKTTKAKPEAEIHPEFAAALAKNRKAKKAFDAFAPSHRREYVEWVAEAKRDATRARRIAQAIEWLAEGKKRNWKYEC
jgi:uncharacterized protein YdeI (YjbR/CyaY-like superfamily)